MKPEGRRFVVAACLISAWVVLAPAASEAGIAVRSHPPGARLPEAPSDVAASDPNPAMNLPDYWAWKRFIEINRTDPATGGVLWEAWASDDETFPSCPDADEPPTWPGRSNRLKVLKGRAQQIAASAEGDLSWYTLVNGVPTATTVDFPQEVRRNRAAFEYIVSNGFYYTEGLAAAFAEVESAVAAAGGSPSQSLAAVQNVIRFPVEAIEIKAEWIPIEAVPEIDRDAYYRSRAVAVDTDGTTSAIQEYALVALHISTKDIPAWFWATWVNEKVLGRCDYIGCEDHFGTTPPYQPPNPSPNHPYPATPLNPELLALMRSADLSPEFENYRLVGSQTNFVDATGQPILLSNNITEQGNLQTGSCMTCHARAAFDSTGSPISVTSETASSSTPLSGDTGVTDNGAPDSTWFWTSENGIDENGDPVDYFSSSTKVTGLTAVSFDFVWGLLFANSVDACD